MCSLRTPPLINVFSLTSCVSARACTGATTQGCVCNVCVCVCVYARACNRVDIRAHVSNVVRACMQENLLHYLRSTFHDLGSLLYDLRSLLHDRRSLLYDCRSLLRVHENALSRTLI